MDDGHRWKRLTVSEAAERLQISKDAVRKRMQRGTLPYDKTLDGHVYVYLDDEEGVDGKGESRGRVLQLSDVASLLAVVSLGTYVVGLFVFWYPISITYTGDFATAWYATSLVSRDVVVGHGVQQLLFPYLATVLLTGVSVLVWMFVNFRLRRRNVRRGARITVIGFFAILVGYPEFYLLLMYYLGAAGPGGAWRKFSRAYEELSPAQLLAFWALVILCYCLLTAWVKLLGGFPKAKKPSKPSIWEASSFGEALRLRGQTFASAPRHSIAAVGLIFIAYFALVLAMSLISAKPPLSSVEISGQRLVKGELLTHTDGFWYVFEQREEKQEAKQGAEQEVKLVAIPDDDVKGVQVSE